VAPAKIVIVGAGTSGVAACISAVGLGADVTILDISSDKLEWISHRFGSNVRALYSNPSSLERACKDADLLIGAVLIPGSATPRLISRGMIELMRPGSVFVDISIDQGGCAETIRPTSLDAPTYVESGIIHYGVCNMPSQTARTSTLALTARTLRYISLIGKLGVRQAVLTVPELRTAMNTHRGQITNDAVGEALAKDSVAPSVALASS
jgi:alanine dehydrogenase